MQINKGPLQLPLERQAERVILPKREYFKKTGDRELDSVIRSHYVPFIRILYRKRIQMITSLIPQDHIDHMLDIGYGPGLLFPELARRCHRMHGVDLHDEYPMVKRVLERSHIHAYLTAGNLLRLNYKNASMNAVISSSVLEHVRDLATALSEMARVLKKDGVVVLGFPVKNKITKILFWLLGFNDDVIHPSSHKAILQEISRHFEIEAFEQFPSFVSRDYALYIAVRLRKK